MARAAAGNGQADQASAAGLRPRKARGRNGLGKPLRPLDCKRRACCVGRAARMGMLVGSSGLGGGIDPTGQDVRPRQARLQGGNDVVQHGMKQLGQVVGTVVWPTSFLLARGTPRRAPACGAAGLTPSAASRTQESNRRTAAGVSAPCRAPAIPGPERARGRGAAPHGWRNRAP